MGGDAVEIQEIEEGGGCHSHLDEGGQAAVLRKHVLVVPTPVGPALSR